MLLIVVIEDDAGTRLLVSQVLKKEGLQVMAAENGVQGLALIRQWIAGMPVRNSGLPHLAEGR